MPPFASQRVMLQAMKNHCPYCASCHGVHTRYNNIVDTRNATGSSRIAHVTCKVRNKLGNIIKKVFLLSLLYILHVSNDHELWHSLDVAESCLFIFFANKPPKNQPIPNVTITHLEKGYSSAVD